MKTYITVALPLDNTQKPVPFRGRVLTVTNEFSDAVYIGTMFRDDMFMEYKTRTGDINAEVITSPVSPVMFGQSFSFTFPDDTGYEIFIYEYFPPENNTPPQPIPVNFVKS